MFGTVRNRAQNYPEPRSELFGTMFGSIRNRGLCLELFATVFGTVRNCVYAGTVRNRVRPTPTENKAFRAAACTGVDCNRARTPAASPSPEHHDDQLETPLNRSEN